MIAPRFDHAALGWRVLLLGGASGIGKSTVAARLGQRLGIPWLQADDFRLAFERSGFPIPDAAQVPTFDGTGGLITVGELLSPTVEVVIENHVDQRNPAIFEGDAILLALFERPSVQQRTAADWVRVIFLYEPEERVIYETMQARGRAFAGAAHARKNWRYSEWLRQEAGQRNLPTLPARPWDTLEDRILQTAQVPLVPILPPSAFRLPPSGVPS